MNNVNSISQMNSMVCEHSSLISHEGKRPPSAAMVSGEKGPEGKNKIQVVFKILFDFLKIIQIYLSFLGDTKEYPLLPPNDSCPTSPRSRFVIYINI